LEAIGDRYYRDDFYNKIQQESYRRVLCIMADRLDGWVTKEEIRTAFSGSLTTLASAIKALRERHIIMSKEGERGVYRLQHKGFALWIKLETTNAIPEDFSELISH
jgi:predicted transcriptional regulator